MKMLMRAFGAFWRNSLSTMLQYRGEIALWALWGIIFPAVAMTMWSAALRDTGDPHGASIKGYDRAAFAAYFLLTMIVGHFAAAWDAFEMSWLVRSGRMSGPLMRPVLPLLESLANNLAYKAVTLTFLIPSWLVIAWIVRPRFAAGPAELVLGVAAVVLAAAVNYVWGYTIGLLAFWTTRADAISELWFGTSLMIGGRSAPLALLPGPLRWIADLLPFKWVFWFPSEVLMGRVPGGDVIIGVAVQAAWLIGGLLAFRLMWRAALRQYSAVGA
jgi:ABC-2 type transport system permease protein